MVAPYQEADHRDRKAGKYDELVSEDSMVRVCGDQLADHTHTRQNHDVDRRMRIEPEQVLEENRIAAQRGIEYTYSPDAFHCHQCESDCDNWRTQHHDDRG